MALIVGKYKIERADRLNLRAYEYKVPEQNNKAKTDKPKWMPLNAFFGNLDAALSWLYEQLVSEAMGERDMDAAGLLRECMRVKDELVDASGGDV